MGTLFKIVLIPYR